MFHTRLEVVGCGGDPASSRIRTLFLPSRLLRLGSSRGSRDGPECRGNLLSFRTGAPGRGIPVGRLRARRRQHGGARARPPGNPRRGRLDQEAPESAGNEARLRQELPPALRHQDRRHAGLRKQPRRNAQLRLAGSRYLLGAARVLELRHLLRRGRVPGIRNRGARAGLSRAPGNQSKGQDRAHAPLRAPGEGQRFPIRRQEAQPVVRAALQGAPGARARGRRDRVRDRTDPGRGKRPHPGAPERRTRESGGNPRDPGEDFRRPDWLRPAGIDLRRFQEDVDRDLKPRSVASTGTRITGTVALRASFEKAENLAGVIPGQGALKNEYVVVGAHYDHLGYGGEHSMRPNEHAIHNGADDNASGTVGAMLIGEALGRSLAGVPDRRSILIALFSGEEVGLAGSAWFVQHPPVPIPRVAAMINLDMVGRLRQDQLIALGSDTAPEWKDLIDRAARDASLHVTSRGDGYGPSDQTSFYAVGVPVLHLFTGAHEQYHSPEDKPATVNPEGAAKVVSFAVSLGEGLASASSRPQYVRASSGPAMGGDSRGYGSYLGTIPDYSAMESSEGGVLLAD